MDIIRIVMPCIVLGLLSRYISKHKGYEGGFWIGFLLNVFGLLFVLLRPSRNAFSKVFDKGSSAIIQAFGSGEASIYKAPDGIAFCHLPNGSKVKVISCTKDAVWALVENDKISGYVKTMYMQSAEE